MNRKLLILLIKFMPIIQLMGMILNNTMYYFGINNSISYTFDFIIGNSLLTTFLMYVGSYIFLFCTWHRIIITACLVNLIIANIDSIIHISISDLQLLCSYYIVGNIFIIIAIINHIKKKK